MPSVDQSGPLAPLSFIAGLRPQTPKSAAQPVFTVTTDTTTPGYFAIANVDFYDGAGWSFHRTFRPSGGVLPADTDAALTPRGELTQQYHIAAGPLTNAPWMPFVYRAQKVTGQAVDIDPASGMIVPLGTLNAGTTYTVRSGTTTTTFDRLRAAIASPDTATPTIDTELPGSLRTALDQVVRALSQETHTPSTPALPFLQALQRDLRANYTLSSAARGVAATTVSPTPTPTTSTPKSIPSRLPSRLPSPRRRQARAGPATATRARPASPTSSPRSSGRTGTALPSSSPRCWP